MGYLDKPCDTPSILSKLKLKNVNRLVTGNLNINSLPGKFDQLKVVIENNIDILIVKIDSSFSSSQFLIKGFSIPFRFDRNRSGGVVIFYVRDDIPSKQLTNHKLPDDIEGVFIEVNLRKIKWLIFDTYHPSSQPVEYFFKHVDCALDAYAQIYIKFLLASDFNTERTEPCLSEFLTKYDSKSLAKDKICFKNPENPRCIDIFITDSIGSFQKTTVVASGLSDFHKMVVTVCKASFQKSKPQEILYRNYKRFDIRTFKNVLRLKLQSIKSYESFE